MGDIDGGLLESMKSRTSDLANTSDLRIHPLRNLTMIVLLFFLTNLFTYDVVLPCGFSTSLMYILRKESFIQIFQ
jgi:hypothetical protein